MKKKRNNITTKQAVVIFVALFAIFYALIYVVPTVTDIFKQTYIAEYGTIEISRDTEGIIVRDEKTYVTNNGGKVKREVEAGELMKANRHIVTVGGQAMYNEGIGIVSYYYDTFEKSINSETLDGINKEFFTTFKESAGVQKAVSGTAEAGNVVFKIIDRTKWHLVCWLAAEDEEVFYEGRTVTVAFDEENQVQMEVASVEKEGKEIKVVLKADVNGSLEAVKNALEKIDVEGVKVSVIRGGVGAITESDIEIIKRENLIEREFGEADGIPISDDVYSNILNDNYKGMETSIEINNRAINEILDIIDNL